MSIPAVIRSSVEGVVDPSGASEQRRVDAERQGAAVRSARLVVVEVRGQGSGLDLVREQMVQHQHIGLFDDLGPAHALGAEEQVGGDRSLRCDVADE